MKILIIDHVIYNGSLLAQRLSRDGHDVVYASVWGPKGDSPFMGAVCRGLPNVRVDPDGWMNWVKWADVATITGSEHRGHTTAFLRKNGVPVCGPGRWAVQLELDRAYGDTIFREMGLTPPKSEVFESADAVVDYVQKYPSRYVVKLDQTARALGETFVGRDPEGKDVIDFVSSVGIKLRFAGGAVKLYLNEYIDGTEVGIGGWFNGKRLLGDLMVNYEADGGYAYDFTVDASRFLDRERLESVLAKYKYRGSFDFNGFLTDKDEYRPIDWTPRWGGGTTEFFCHSANDLGKLIYACATGGESEVLAPRNKNRVGLAINLLDYSDEMNTPTDVILPKGSELPYFKDEDSSFWVMWPTKVGEGWMHLPVHGNSERKVGMYVAYGDTFGKALRKAELLSQSATVAGASFSGAIAEDDLRKRFERGRKFALGEGWIHSLAQETKFYWGRVKKP